MKKILLLIIGLTSCYSTEIINYQELKTKSIDVSNDILIEIKNNAQNVILEVNDYSIKEMGNIKESDSFTPFILEYGESDSLTTFKSNSQYLENCTILLNGEITTEQYDIYNGLIFIPLSKSFNLENNKIILELYDGCP